MAEEPVIEEPELNKGQEKKEEVGPVELLEIKEDKKDSTLIEKPEKNP